MNSSSPARSERHAKVHPRRAPLTMPGSAAGRITRVHSTRPRAPMVRAARKSSGGMVFTALSVARVMESSDPSTMTTWIAASPRPNQSSASGSQHTDGTAWRPSTSTPTVSFTTRTRARHTPRTTPPASDT